MIVTPIETAPIAPRPTPHEAPLSMPAQNLAAAPPARFPRASARTRAARIVAFGGGAAIAALGAWQMGVALSPGAVGPLQIALLVLFAITFGWIGFGAASTLSGLLFGPPRAAPAQGPLGLRVALVMPVYNEAPEAPAGALAAMAEGLARIAPKGAFEVFVISDTTCPDRWAQETAAFAALRERLAGRVPVWYRRRPRNLGRKAGNVAEFIRRWGGRYDLMLVLDADSLMAPGTILEMALRMQAEPDLGLLQTAPKLAFGETLFARLQQFASALHGGPIARGVAAWQGADGNFWGHNAMIRTRAFAAAAGLPELPGRKPFGGAILSHDFVEAALLRRAGWRVVMDADLGGSWEGAPPTLDDAAARDRRWAQGNLQHLAVIGAAGLRWPNRAHFGIGILSYLMSPIWLLMLAVGLWLTWRALGAAPAYFESERQLFPDWPRFDTVRMGWLLGASAALLLLPKLIGLFSALLDGARRRAMGGAGRIVAGFLIELLVTTLLAPVMMLIQSRQIAEILAGRDSGWAAQSRAASGESWRGACARRGAHVALGVALGIGLAALAPEVLIWLAPIVAGLIAAPALTRAVASPWIGRALARHGLLAIPEERAPAPAMEAAAAAEQAFAARRLRSAAALASDAGARAAHEASLGQERAPDDEAARLAAATCRAKLLVVAPAARAWALLTPDERIALLASPRLLSLWSRRAAAPAG
mgnify:CR=1 FL=1